MFPKLGNSFMDINKIERKLNKLKREPDIFIKDMIANKKNSITNVINKIKPVKLKTKNKYTIVSAVYNVEKYLDEYFSSIINQSISFKESIYIICVDDGSTDNSAKIIKKWQKKYPNNIQYIYKENGGQSSARNLGLNHVKTNWVTMIDPDDFLHSNFFLEIDKAINQNQNVKLVAPNFIFYFEDIDVKKDTHPLKYKFSKTHIVKCNDLKSDIHLHAASSVFNYSIIKKAKLKFNPDIKPSFEDGKFIADYLLLCLNADLIFLKSAIYYYRKRSDSTSTLDTAWSKVEKFTNVLTYGHLDMLSSYQKKLGKIPEHIQRTVLYDIAWYINYLTNYNGRMDFLSKDQKEIFSLSLFKIFEYIDINVIMAFNLAGVWFRQKVGMLGCFKHEKPTFQIAYIENIDKNKKQILVNVITNFDICINFKLNTKDIIPDLKKVTQYDFAEHVFVNELRFWVTYDELDDFFSIEIDSKVTRLSILGKQYISGCKIGDIVDKFEPSYKYNSDDSWLFIDRDCQADDNAEHLYRYILKNNLKENCYFALSKKSSDWSRLEMDGFRLVDYGSDEFESKLKKCSKIISSNLDHYITNYFGDEYEYSKKIVFLQHGVIHNDLSNWLNTKKNLNCFITSTESEYKSIISDHSHYKFSTKEVVLSGMPRHDALLEIDKNEENIILIMPTWRNNIVGKSINNTNNRLINDGFKDEEYCISWESLLNSRKLYDLTEKYGYKIIFSPHINIEPYVSIMNIPSFVHIWKKDEIDSLQNLFKKTKIFITDYSSIAFDIAYLEKSIIYYQFDKNDFFSGNHTSQKGYFEYERDGFGPVVEEVSQVEYELEKILQNEGKPLEPYLSRMQATFPFKDGRCCERVYNAIVALDCEDKVENLELANDFLHQAFDVKNYKLVKERAEKILLNSEITKKNQQIVYEKLAESYVQLQDWDALKLLLEKYSNDYYFTKLLASQSQWEEILNIIGSVILVDEYYELRLSSLFNLNQLQFEKINTTKLTMSEYENYLYQCYRNYINAEWESLVENLNKLKFSVENMDNILDFYTKDDLMFLQLMASKYLDQLDVENIKNLSSKNIDFILQKSLVLSEMFASDEALKGFRYVDKEKGLAYFDLEALQVYISELCIKGEWKNLVEKLPECIDLYPNENVFKAFFIQVLGELEQWKDLVKVVEQYSLENLSKSIYFIVLAYYRIGEIEKAYSLLKVPTVEFTYEYWLLSLEIYIQIDDYNKAKKCVKSMYAIFPNRLQETKNKFNLLYMTV